MCRLNLTQRHKGHKGYPQINTDYADFFGGRARVCLTTEYTEHTERHCSVFLSHKGTKDTKGFWGHCSVFLKDEHGFS